jgi:hypothetical protein
MIVSDDCVLITSPVVKFNIVNLTGVITSPGYPLYMQRANYEWTFRKTAPHTKVVIYLEDIDLRRRSDG